MSNNQVTILRLDRSRTDRAFKPEESLWDAEIGRMCKLIANHVQALDKYKKEKGLEKPKEMPRLSIGIYGSPGSGKSSLVETFVEMVNDEENPLLKGLQCNFHSLPVIKPNVLAKDEHFLYKFLATALNEDKIKRNKGAQHRESSILSELEQTFQEVSQYLQVINEVERKQDDDPLGVSLDRLDRHESGVKLVEEMGKFISMLADSLVGSKTSSVIFMPVDDADLSMDTLISAIGTCWRYLQHPRLIPIFTFTGRLAEELLRVHFEEKLTIKGIAADPQKLEETSISLRMTENMAMQYLGKLFPVRNRIRMGPASARVLGAKYISSEYKCTKKKETDEGDGTNNNEEISKVLDLLKAVSKLLFGHTREPVPAIRPPLRMVTLRRQVQIVDAMQATGIERFMTDVEKKENAGKSNQEKSWGQLFDLATWSLLNTHRDVLKEINMNLDDLYSWTPKGMRQVVLDSILKMDHEKRSRILKHWRYRTEDRRSQVLSLLAANVFRPRMAGEELTGDEPDIIEKRSEMNSNVKVEKEDQTSFPISQGLLWFINLCIGFYVPQILACNRPGKGAKTDMIEFRTGAISGIGWDSSSGPIHAVREAIGNKKIFSTGMLFLNPKTFTKQIQIEKTAIEAVVKAKTKAAKTKAEAKFEKYINPVLYINIWCFYGFRDGKPWTAVSLWRGLGLIAQLLKLVIDTEDGDYKNKIIAILRKHLDSALVWGDLPKGREGNDDQNDRLGVVFPKWDAFYNEYLSEEREDSKKGGAPKIGETREKRLDAVVTPMAEDLETWLKKICSSKRIFPMLKPDEDDEWKKCFTRRIHAENLMGIFWQDLENKYYQRKLNDWNLHLILSDWFSLLEDYWKGCRSGYPKKSKMVGIETLLMECPILTGKNEKKVPLTDYKEPLEKIKIETIEEYSVFWNRRRNQDKGTDQGDKNNEQRPTP